MLKAPPQTVTCCPGGATPRDHPIPNSIPVRAALKKERVMTPEAFALLERLTGHAQGWLRFLRMQAFDDTIKASLTLEIAELDDVLDRARHAEKGGPPA